MNKKFSTLATAGLLLSGALFCNVNAKDYNAEEFKALIQSNVLTLGEETDLVVNLTEDVALSEGYAVIKTEGLTLSANRGVELEGRLVIFAEGVTVKGLKIKNAPTAGTGYWTKNAISVFADAVNIKDNVVTQEARVNNEVVANGIVVFPQTTTVNYVISGNTVTANYVTSDNAWASTGILIAEENTFVNKKGDPLWSAAEDVQGKTGGEVAPEYANPSAKISASSFSPKAIAEANTYVKCYSDFIFMGKVPETKSAAAGASCYNYSQVTFNGDNAAAIVSAVANSLPGSSVVVEGATHTEVLDILATGAVSVEGSKAAIACDDALILLGGADAPAGNNLPTVDAAVSSSGVASDAAAQASAFKFNTPFILSANSTNRQALKADATAGFAIATYDKTVASFFWSFEKSETGAATGYAKLVNHAGEYLMIGGKVVGIKIVKQGDKWVPSEALNALALVDIDAGSAAATTGATAYTLCAVGTSPLSATTLNQINGASFGAELLFEKKSLASDPFTGVLKPVKFNSSGEAVALNTILTSYMLQNENGNIIVLRLDKKYSVGTGTYGYHITEMAPKDLYLAINGANAANYVCNFSIHAWDNFSVGVTQEVARISATGSDGTAYDLGALLVGADEELTLAAEQQTGTNVLKTISIKLGKFNLIEYKKFFTKPAFYELTAVNKVKTANKYGKVLGLDAEGNANFVKSEEALLHQPETQWAASFAGNKLVLANRENPTKTYDLAALNAIYKTNESAVFAIGGDTIKIATIEAFDPADGYERLDADKLRDQLYYVGIQSSVWDGIAYTVENHKENHQIGLDTNKDVATEWHLAADRFIKKNALGEYDVNRPDTIKIGSTLNYFKADGTPVSTDKDGKQTVFLKVLSYSLMNQANNEYLRYNNVKDVTRYTTGLDDNKGNVATDEDFDPNYFALKVVGKNADDKVLYNLVKVADRTAKDTEGTFEWQYKVYGGGSRDKGILNRTGMYSQIENDLFVVEEKDAPEYVKLNQGDTIKIFRAETESEVLYQKGEFLGMGNAIEFNKINPALYVDTVYYNRDANNRWEYLLGININRVDTTYKCDEPAHANLMHKADTTFGAFLVNYADSAIVEDTRDIHTNKYVYDNGVRYAKLGFEEGYRTNDALYVARADGKFDKIEVGTPSRQLVKFAFRVVDHEANTFIIETGIKYPEADYIYSGNPSTGYLRWINGNVVVTPLMEDAEVFKLKADDRDPVANEDLSTSSVVVIAGEGQIIVNGAAGKVVTITNVLGQTIAQTVISSDNATIAAPAGVVIVSVEGEVAVKAIVK